MVHPRRVFLQVVVPCAAMATTMTETKTALARARELSAPSATRLRNGDVEDVEFWEEHETLLEAARCELGPKHAYVYDATLEEMYLPRVVAALRSGDPGSELAKLAKMVTEGVYAVELLLPSFLSDLQDELAYLRGSGIPLRRPNGMNRQGCLLSSLGFQNGTLMRLGDVMRPLGLTLYPHALRHDDITDLYGFSIRYDETGDVALAEHADAAALTLNVCLDGAGDLLFRGVRFHDSDAHTRLQQTVTHRPGVALLHLGQHLHSAAPLTSGSRENVVVWATGRHGYVRIAPYDGRGLIL